MRKPKCPDCNRALATERTKKAKREIQRNGDFRCSNCGTAGVTLGSELVVASRFLTLSNPRGGYALNQHHPDASALTKIRARVAA